MPPELVSRDARRHGKLLEFAERERCVHDGMTLVCKVTSTSAVIVSDPMGVATGIAERQSAGARNERFGMALMA